MLGTIDNNHLKVMESLNLLGIKPKHKLFTQEVRKIYNSLLIRDELDKALNYVIYINSLD